MAKAEQKPKFGTPEWRKLHPRKNTGVKKEPVPEFVTKEELNDFGNKLLDGVEAMLKRTAPAPAATSVVETAGEKLITKAGPNDAPINPVWEEKAREIIGDALDHCEVAYLRNGGVIFTIVIKDEFSNAGKDYLARMGSDRRSKEVGSEGIEGVENWCKLVKANLARPH